jgi:hypothetical protein
MNEAYDLAYAQMIAIQDTDPNFESKEGKAIKSALDLMKSVMPEDRSAKSAMSKILNTEDKKLLEASEVKSRRYTSRKTVATISAADDALKTIAKKAAVAQAELATLAISPTNITRIGELTSEIKRTTDEITKAIAPGLTSESEGEGIPREFKYLDSDINESDRKYPRSVILDDRILSSSFLISQLQETYRNAINSGNNMDTLAVTGKHYYIVSEGTGQVMQFRKEEANWKYGFTYSAPPQCFNSRGVLINLGEACAASAKAINDASIRLGYTKTDKLTLVEVVTNHYA